MGGSNLPQAFPNYLVCLRFIRISTVSPGGPDIPLTPPDQCAIKHTQAPCMAARAASSSH